MSLTVYLEGEEKTIECICSDCGNKHIKKESECFFNANITHNLTDMAKEAGIYFAIWRPKEVGIKKANQIIVILETGIIEMKACPDRFKKLESSNGWGRYENFLPWLELYLDACKKYTEASIRVSR